MLKDKLVAVMNKQIEPGRAMNALAHMSLGFGAVTDSSELAIMDYTDGDGNIYPNISKMPYIVLKAKNSNKVRQLFQSAKAAGIKCTVFTETMTVGTWEEQEARTKRAAPEDLVFWGVLLFGPTEIVTELTKKLSLWQ